MSKKLILVLCLVIFFSTCRTVFASILINEVMYDVSGTDTDHEWVEIYNTGTSSVDITGWKFFDGSNHTLNVPPANGGQGSMSIDAGGYAILTGNAATFLADHSGFTGTVIDTVMNLNNSTATLKIVKADNTEADSFTYASSQGANGDGNTLQLINSSWSSGAPTPGAGNHVSSVSASASGGPLVENSSTDTASASSVSKTESKKIELKILAKNIAFTSSPFVLQGIAYGANGEELRSGKYFWNFGDGDSKEYTNSTESFSHTYFYGGDYVVTLEYYSASYSKVPDATVKIKLKVVPATLIISKVGDESDFFVELSNKSEYDIDVSGWALYYGSQTFSFPHNSVINSNDKLTLSPQVTKFNMGEGDTIKLATETGKVVYEYSFSQPDVPQAPVERNSETVTKDMDSTVADIPKEPEVEAVDLTSSVGNSGALGKSNSYLPMFAFGILLVGSAGSVYFIRRKKLSLKAGEDFELLDE